MITLDILEQRLFPIPYFDACLVCLFSIIINPIFICTIKTLRVSIKCYPLKHAKTVQNIPKLYTSQITLFTMENM